MHGERLTQRFALCIHGKAHAAVAECLHDIRIMRCRSACRNRTCKHDVIIVAVFAQLFQQHLRFRRRDRNASAVQLRYGMILFDL